MAVPLRGMRILKSCFPHMKKKTIVQSFGSRGVMSRKQVWKVIGLTLLCCGWQFSSAQGVNYIPFDAPGAVPGTYIQPQAINPAGVITGYYANPGNAAFGFVRDPNGTVTSFGQPGTQPQAINPSGTIVGYYSSQGFVRDPTVPSPPSIYRAPQVLRPLASTRREQ
jgi:hypothetical protein